MINYKKTSAAHIRIKVVFTLMVILLVTCGSQPLLAKQSKDCTKTAKVAYQAAIKQAWQDFWIAVGNCYNLSDPDDRAERLEAAQGELKEAKDESKEQREARCEICEKLGEAPYDPVIIPADFVDFAKVLNGIQTLTPNSYFPLIPGTTWEYLASDAQGGVVERILVEVLQEAKEILGVNCIVVRDRVWEVDEKSHETLIEDTLDWYAQDTAGRVWYFGEISQEFEGGELVGLEGSWKAGRDSAKPGFVMLANPQKDDIYRQEFFLGEAEDMAKVVGRGEESVSVPFSDYNDDVLKTQEWSPIEPDVLEFKYYAPGVGCILEANPDTGERVELIDMANP